MASASTADHHSIRGYVLTAIRTAVPLAIICASLLASVQTANAVVQRIYTFPFFSNYYLSCGFGCYDGHQGTDYQLSPLGTGGERVSAAMAGTAKVCDDPFFPGAGHYIVMNHGNGHITRYLHLSGWAAANGVVRGRGGLIGYEGNSGVADGSYHLHFETRHGAGSFTCGKDGTAVNPYSGSTYMWLTNPPSYAQKMNDFNGDGFSDTLSFNAAGQAIVGLNNAPTPTFQPLANWGTVFSFATGEIPSTGDFNRDGYTDTIAFVPSTGNAIVGINQLPAPGGGPWFSLQNWGYVYWSADLPEVGDFNGDGYSDTIAFNTQGRAIVGINRVPITGQPTFSPLQDWGYVFWYGGPDIPLLGDFDANGRTDTVAFNTQSRAIVGINQGSSFTLHDWGVVFSFAGLEIPSTGDFDGDGRTDTFARRSDGQAIIGLNQGSSFSLHNWGTVGAWGEIPIVAQYDWNSYADTQSFQHPPTGCSHAIVALGSGGSGFQGLGDWGTVGCWPEIPAGFQAFAYEKRWDRWFAAW